MRTQKIKEGGCHQEDIISLFSLLGSCQDSFTFGGKRVERTGRAIIQSEEVKGTVSKGEDQEISKGKQLGEKGSIYGHSWLLARKGNTKHKGKRT